MIFRETFVFVVLLVAVFAIGCSTTSHQAAKEPSYQNRQLSDWLGDFDYHNHSAGQQALAADAIRHIGSAAVPFLVERLSEAKLKQSKIDVQKWRERQSSAGFTVELPPNPRYETMAGLDALGSAAVAALPALEKLLHDDPPDTQALYVAARIGAAGVPLLTQSLTSENKLVRLWAQICLDMMSSCSEVLYPKIPVGQDAPCLARRICEFNLKVMQGALKAYKANHREMEVPNDLNQTPPPSSPPP